MTESPQLTISIPTNGIASAVLNPESIYLNRQEHRMQKYFALDDHELNMSFIETLIIRMGKKRSVRNLLSGFGVRQWCTFSAFLAKLHNTDVIALLYNWILRETQHDEKITFRIVEDYTDDVYQLTLSSRKGGLYVERLQKRQDLKNKILYYWPEDVTFATLTREKIEQSMIDADHFNKLHEQCPPPEEETTQQWCIRQSSRNRAVPYVIEKAEH